MSGRSRSGGDGAYSGGMGSAGRVGAPRGGGATPRAAGNSLRHIRRHPMPAARKSHPRSWSGIGVEGIISIANQTTTPAAINHSNGGSQLRYRIGRQFYGRRATVVAKRPVKRGLW
ncbi:hypothetical protein MTOK_46360 [Mycolicibacterium tokaiense]|nr:hypothetical protein MTOK_46360 [Mycolicibacterium tokaiense]